MTEYRAKLDTMIEGKPTAEGALVKGLSDDKVKAYVEAGLIEEVKAETKTKDEKKADQVFADAAKKIDTTSDKRTEK